MIDIKNFTYGRPRGLAEGMQGALSIQKNEKITRAGLRNFNWIHFLHMMDLQIFTNGSGGGGLDFFLHITILFHLCNNENEMFVKCLCM